MFKKFKDRLTEVSEEVKRDPRFVNSLASVNQLAQQTYSALNKEKNGSRESLNQLPPTPSFSKYNDESVDIGVEAASLGGHRRSASSDFQQSNFHPTANLQSLTTSASSPSLANHFNMASNSFFSLTEEDDAVISQSPSKGNDPSSTSSPLPRSRRLSSGSMTTEAANLFPIYESPQQVFQPLLNDLDSTAGSEWDEDASSQQRLTSISKEQLFQMLQKARGRYHKYKGRYSDLVKAYQDMERENGKIKTVMQQTQDKALRRISELKEQCQLEQKAKRHLEEELRSDLEEKQHVIEALQTKVTLLKSGGRNVIDDNEESLVDVSEAGDGLDTSLIKRDADKVAALEEKIKRLEGLLTKCKESIKANKQKTTALTEVKESLAKQVSEREADLNESRSQLLSAQTTLASAQKEIENFRNKEQQEELQIAEIKMMMHQEMITKDEEIGKLRTNLKHAKESLEEKEGENAKLQEEIDLAKEQQMRLEKSLESEKAAALQEMSRGKSSALQTLQAELSAQHEKDKKEMTDKHQQDMDEKLQSAEREKQRELALKEEELHKRLREKEEEGRLALEELELRLSSLSAKEDSKSKLNQELELKITTLSSEKQQLQNELSKLKEELNTVCEQIKEELKDELETLRHKLKETQEQLEQANKSLSEAEEKHSREIGVFEAQLSNVGAEKEDVLRVTEENERLKQSLKAKEEHVHQVEATLKVIETELETQTHAFEQLHGDHQSSASQLSENNQKLQEARGEVDRQKSQCDELREKLNSAEESAARLERQIQEKSAEHSSEIGQLKEEVVSKSEKLGHFEKLVKELQDEQMNSLQELETCKNEITAKTEKITKLEDILQQEKNKYLTVELQLDEMKSQLLEVDENHNSTLAAVKKRSTELEKEILDLKNREASLKGNEQQMISYQKELQDQISTFEGREMSLQRHVNQLEDDVADKEKEIEQMALKNSQEIATLKADLELKMRHEREKENSYKDLQMQSIEYQKKLQDQLTDMEEEVAEAKSKAKMHTTEVSKLSERITELTNELSEAQGVTNHLEELEARVAELAAENESLRETEANWKESEQKRSSASEDFMVQIEKLRADLENAQSGKQSVEGELSELEEKLQLTNQMLYDAQNLASSRDSEIEDLKARMTSMAEDSEGLRRDLKQSQADKALQMNEFEETLVSLEKQVADLKSKNELLQEQTESQSRKLEENQEQNAMQTQLEESHQQALQETVKKYESMLTEKEESTDAELARFRDESEAELRKTVQDFNVQIADLRQELYEKSAMYDEMIENHQSELLAKQEELDREVEACNRMYHAKISEVEAANEEKLRELEKRYNEENNSWNWERATSIDEDVVEDLQQRTPTREQREQQLRQMALAEAENPATLSVTVTNHCNHAHSLEDAAEFEYLRNVLYQYMLGKESVTLARVVATVLKFTPDELREVIKHEEKKHSLLASLGILPHH